MPETGLMKKTERELVEIILRKDDVHVKLNEEIKVLEESIKTKDSTLDDVIKLNTELNDKLDIYMSSNVEHCKTIESLNKQIEDFKDELDDAVIKELHYIKYMKLMRLAFIVVVAIAIMFAVI